MTERLETTSRLVQWRIDDPRIHYAMKSQSFKIGHWEWNFELGNLRLIPKPCEHGPPIASFNIRLVSLVGGRKVLAHTVVRDEELKWSEGFLWTINYVDLTSVFIIEVEFFDLKTASPKVLIEFDGCLKNQGQLMIVNRGCNKDKDRCDSESESKIGVHRCDENVTASSSLGRMLLESIHTDITIWASDGSIGAHRAVLAARSPVFDRMFIHDLKEKDSSSINIPDMSIVVCQAFLNYLYSNNIQYQEFLTLRLDLLKAADKYDVTDLKDVCHESLIDDIDSGNVLERLQTAFVYRLTRLKACCIEYLVKFGKIFDIKEEFNAFIQSADRELVKMQSNSACCFIETKHSSYGYICFAALVNLIGSIYGTAFHSGVPLHLISVYL
ncbi:BTB/POZ domain-containing protein [Artemisia annua]|uniref:BTB/POZ domain-containing protein n=1 Tax=Artemisia annua TaxID=35608 RepID=A0A2U1NFJ5_ARTAN|nr:BTB/POZ domain-containing protein [Artemisia annua]